MCIIEKPYNRSYDGGYSNQLRYLDKMIDLKITELVGAGEMEKPINIDEVLKHDLILHLKFIDENDNQITKILPIKIVRKNIWL